MTLIHAEALKGKANYTSRSLVAAGDDNQHSGPDLGFCLGKLVTSWGFTYRIQWGDSQNLPVTLTVNPCCSSLFEPVILNEATWSIIVVTTEIWKK